MKASLAGWFFLLPILMPIFAAENTTFEDMPALSLANDRLELKVLPRGSAIASIVLRDDPNKLNPLWDPIRMARELGRKNTFGGGTGHFLCLDGFGPVSPEEKAAGLPGHGEAHLQQWEVRAQSKEGGTSTLTLATRLPITQENLTRTMRVVDGENVVYVETELESLLGFDRPICWGEHATIGSPFLEPGVTVVDLSAKRAQTRPYEAEKGGLPHRLPPGKDFDWPMAPTVGGGQVDLRAAPANPDSIDHSTSLMDTSRELEFVSALNPGRRLVLGYVFKRAEYPWTQNWENYPATLKMARGMEFSTQPYDVPRREVVDENRMFGVPLYRWLPAKSKIGTRFLMFYAHVPDGFKKVDDVRLENGILIIEDRKANLRVRLKASLPL
ncbi:MAG: hypothetical protein M3Y07_16970 [Acidobacteriota bacterium]|nr:hypothetical protein [Acidobacteriota bacterium]